MQSQRFSVFFAFVLGFAQCTNLMYRGVNQAVAEFGDVNGAYNTAYTYPATGSVDYFATKGANIVRFPFLWERVQKTLGGALDSTEMGRMDTFVNYVTVTKNSYLLLDPHNYARYRGAIIGQSGSGVTVDHFKDFWTKLANRYKSNSKVIFGIMNEPNSMDTTLWKNDCQAAIDAIRATGATNLLMVPGNHWTGAHSWVSSDNDEIMGTITDSGNNFVFELHQYLDGDSSGTNENCVSSTIGSERLVAVTTWLRNNGKKGFLGEFGGGRNTQCYQALDNMLTYMETNSDVWVGFSYWSAGPWWDEYIFTIEPTNNFATDRPQMTNAIAKHLTAPTSSATTGPATTGPATTGPATTGPATTGRATTGPATTGSASTTGGKGVTGSSLKYKGVNEASLEFGDINGAYNTAYTMPTTASVDYMFSKGMNTIRLPFLWERLQKTLNGEFDSNELNRMDIFVTYVTNKGGYLILDPHNYARYRGAVIGQSGSGVTIDHFNDFWTKLANHWKDNSKVIFGIMNEPNSMETQLWKDVCQAAINAIRATGASNLITVPGNYWTGAHSWVTSDNDDIMVTINDPINNFIFELHQYLDSDSSGRNENCVSSTIGSERLVAVTTWLRNNGKKGFLGEFAGGANTLCYQALDNMLTYMETNSDVWVGWTWWAAGPWWAQYMYTIEPSNGNGDQLQMSNVLQYHLAAYIETSSTTGVVSSTSGGGAVSTTGQISGNGHLKMVVPAKLPQNGSFEIQIQVNVTSQSTLTVVLLDPNGIIVGQGQKTVVSPVLAFVSVTITKNLEDGVEYTIRATLTDSNGDTIDTAEAKVNNGNGNAIPEESGCYLLFVNFVLLLLCSLFFAL